MAHPLVNQVGNTRRPSSGDQGRTRLVVVRSCRGMPMSTPQFVGGRLRAYLEFVAAVVYYFLARSVAHHSAAGLASDAWSPLVEQAMLLFLLLLGYAAFGLVLDRQKHPISEQGSAAQARLDARSGNGLGRGVGSRRGLRAAFDGGRRDRHCSGSAALGMGLAAGGRRVLCCGRDG